MPWLIRPKGKQFVLLNQDTGVQKGPEFATHDEARNYQKALYANDPSAVAEAKKIEAAGKGGQELWHHAKSNAIKNKIKDTNGPQAKR
jgi:hypothetical protein